MEAIDNRDTELWEYNGGDFELITQAQPFIQWLRERPTHYVVQDLLFVHAGVRPNVPLEEQTLTDLTWIRDPFLNSPSHDFLRACDSYSWAQKCLNLSFTQIE